MANKQTIETYVIDESALNEVIDEISTENREAFIEPMDGNTNGSFLMSSLFTAEAAGADVVGNLVSFIGKVTKIENDENGVLGVIHVDDGSGEVLVFLDGYIDCDDGCTPGADGYHDLSAVQVGAWVRVRGIASIGQNSYENSDQIGPRIRLRNRADVEQFVPVFGDANLDGVVTAADAALVLRALVGLSAIAKEGMVNADVAPDNDLKPNAADAAAILRYVVGLIKNFEIEN
jgi:hypothetical protein